MTTLSMARTPGSVLVPMVSPMKAAAETPPMIMMSCFGVKAMAAFCAFSASSE